MGKMKLIKEKITDFIKRMGEFGEYSVYVPQIIEGGSSFLPVSEGSSPDFSLPNTKMPAKSLFYPQTETLFRYRDGETAIQTPGEANEMIVLGIRPCDARALSITDNLFSWDPADPYYKGKRDKATLFGFACSKPCTNCFCTSVGGGPASKEGLDALVTDLGDSYHIEVLTEKGVKICQLAGDILQIADDGDSQAAEKIHAEAAGKFARSAEVRDIPSALPSLWDNDLWKKNADACLSCGICTFLCPTCHCFDIQDEVEGIEGRRCRAWDSCMFREYSVHGSGHNPRPTRRERTRNRINHKYSYFVEKFGVISCVGCGRCINLCPVNIDILNILSQIKEAGTL